KTTGDLAAAEGRIAAVASEIQRLQQAQRRQQETLEALVADVRSRVAEVKNDSAVLRAEEQRIQTAQAALASKLPALERQTTELSSQVGSLAKLSDTTKTSLQQTLREVNRRFETLDAAATKAREDLANIESELQTSHYVFTAHVEYPVWGKDIYI